jgi:hypothetical protein
MCTHVAAATDHFSEGSFVWLAGEEMRDSVTANAWESGQPSSDTLRNCVTFDDDGEWSSKARV